MTAGKKIIAVVGATGAQGGGLVRAILEQPGGPFAARAITRDPSSPAAKALASAGAEVVYADVDDLASLERAFTGVHGAFCVTFFWAHMQPEREVREAENMARAAKRAGVRHAIWSTLDDSRRWVALEDPRMPTLMGHYKVPHFDAKSEGDRFFADFEVRTTYLLTSFYWDNFIHFGMGPRRMEDGSLALVLPLGRARLPGIAAEDIGRCAYGIFARGDVMIDLRVGIAGGMLTGEQMASKMGAAIGEPVRYLAIPPDAYRALGFPGADDLGNMFQWQSEHEAEYCASRSVEAARSLNPQLMSFDDWLAKHAKEIPIPPRVERPRAAPPA